MSDGILEVVPIETEVFIDVGGERFRLGMLTINDWALIANEVRKLRPDPIAVAAAMCARLESRDEKVFILERAWSEARRAQVVPEAEVAAWSLTPEGAAFMLWLAVLHYHPEQSREVVESWIKPFAEDGYGRNLREVVELVNLVHAKPPAGPT